MTSQKKIVVGFPLYDQITLLDFAGATEMFAYAEQGGEKTYECIWLAPEIREYSTTSGSGVVVKPGYTFYNHPPINVLFVPGAPAGYYNSQSDHGGFIGAMKDHRYIEFVQRVANSKDCEWAGSVCTGAFIMAAAGLFNDCKVTTHWAFLDSLKLFSNKCNIQVIEKNDDQDYPRSVLDEEHQRFSGGGVSSSIDLAVELINKITGENSAKWTTLTNQYAPDPIFKCGDPALAEQSGNSALTDDVLSEWGGALQDTKDAVNHVLESSKPS